MMYKIVFIDIDGTLVDDDKIIPSKAKEAVEKLKHAGFEVVLATGRPPFHFYDIAEELNIHSFVSFNGSYMVHEGKVIQKYPLEREYIEKLVDHSEANNHPLVFSGMDKAVSNFKDHPEVMKTFIQLHLNYTPDYVPDYWKQDDIYQVMLYCKEHEEDYYAHAVPDLSYVRWHELAMDVMPKGLSKALGIKDILDYRGISPQEAVAFGDGLNDREMLDYVGMGIAMGNAHPDLFPYADVVTKSVHEDGLTHGLAHLKLIK